MTQTALSPANHTIPQATAPQVSAPQATTPEVLRALIDAQSLSQADIARQAGIAASTLSAWITGTYAGNNDRVAAQVDRWLAARSSQQSASATVPKAPGFLLTPSAKAFIEALTFAQVIPEITVIAGGAGIGKTSACVHYAATTPHVWIATMDPATAGVHPMLGEICDVMGLMEQAASRLVRAIGRKVTGTQGLIIIDEAQHLTTAALDQLRSIHDRTRVGIALVGNETVLARLQGDGRASLSSRSGGRSGGFAQLYSRVGVRLIQPQVNPDDVTALLAAWNVAAADEIRFLGAVARKPGALRSVSKCLQLASMLAAGRHEPRTMAHLKAAWDRLSIGG